MDNKEPRFSTRTKTNLPLIKLDKAMPSVEEIERSVISCVLLYKTAILQIDSILSPDDFYSSVYACIFQSALNVSRLGKTVDRYLILEDLKKNDKAEFIGGLYALVELESYTSSDVNIEYHARVIIEYSIRRQLILISRKAEQDAFDDTLDIFELRYKVEQRIFKLNQYTRSTGAKSIARLSHENFERYKKALEGIISSDAIPSGHVEIDAITGGWQKSDLIIIAARPGMGKSAMAVQQLLNAAKLGKVGAIFSLEMSSFQLTNRAISNEGEIHSDRLRDIKKCDDLTLRQIEKTKQKLANLTLFIDDTPNMSVMEMRSVVRRLIREAGLEYIIVDYLQFVKPENPQVSREQQVAQISRDLKGLAKEFAIPVIALASLSRKVEDRGGDKRPLLSDLRDSGSIESDAVIVMFLYRPETYKITQDENGHPTDGLLEVDIAKHRNGAIGTVKLRFIGKFSKVRSLEDY